MVNRELMKEKNLVIPTYILEVVKKLELKYSEFLLLIYFWNFTNSVFDITEISKTLKLNEEEIMNAFNCLLAKKIIKIDSYKDISGKITERINLDILYNMIDDSYNEIEKEQEQQDIFTIFEKEFGRPISSIEYEIIRAWIEKGFKEELILGALKEAVYNGVNSLRYIEAILYDWQKKGYKTMKEVNNRTREIKEEKKELFDYNWLDDNE